jgi:hypothetical protein
MLQMYLISSDHKGLTNLSVTLLETQSTYCVGDFRLRSDMLLYGSAEYGYHWSSVFAVPRD